LQVDFEKKINPLIYFLRGQFGGSKCLWYRSAIKGFILVDSRHERACGSVHAVEGTRRVAARALQNPLDAENEAGDVRHPSLHSPPLSRLAVPPQLEGRNCLGATQDAPLLHLPSGALELDLLGGAELRRAARCARAAELGPEEFAAAARGAHRQPHGRRHFLRRLALVTLLQNKKNGKLEAKIWLAKEACQKRSKIF